MKKFALIFAVILLVCCLTVTLVACGDDDKEIKQQEQNDYSKAEIISAKNIVFDGTTGHYTVPNATKTYSFINEIEVSKYATWQLSTDITAQNVVPSKTVSLEAGDNTFYILVTSGDGNNIGFYTVIIRRRPIYTVSFNSNGGASCENQYVEEDKCASAPTTTRTGYSFADWKWQDNEFDFSTPITTNMTLYAVWDLVDYNITYNLDGGTNNENNPATYTIESSTITLATPTKTGYTFGGWYSESGFENKMTSIPQGSYGDKTLYAKWTPTAYTISYTLNGGSVSGTNPTSYTIESDDITLINPTRTGYTFVGWSGTEIEDKSTEVTISNGSIGVRSYTVNWQAIEYSITYNLNGGANNESNPSTYTIESSTITLATPTKTGYAFAGWYSESGFENEVTSISKGSYGDKTLYAKWTSISYTITYNLDGGSVDGTNPTSYTIESNDITLINPTKTGDKFLGWSETDIEGKSMSVTIKKGSIGDRLYSANWEMSIFEYTATSTTCTITGIKDKSVKSIVIPDYVTSIGDRAFRYCSGLTSITIPDSVTSIGVGAFEECSGLTSVTIGNSVTSIGICAFYGCSGLTSITIPDSVTSIGDWAFLGCSGLTSITIPDSVKSIGGYAFYGCSGLTTVNWNAINCTSAGSSDYPIFSGCTKLATVNIGNSVKTIPRYAFYKCSGLTSVTIGNSATSIGEDAFYGCSNLVYNEYDNAYYVGNDTNPYVVLMKAKNTSITSCEIHPNTKVIYLSAFYECSGLTSITIPDSVTSIGKSAFYECSGLTSITIPDSVTSIGDWAFYGCSGLTSVMIGNSVTSIGYRAFSYCSGLTSVTIPDSVTSIGYDAFSGCSGLTSVTIPDSVTSIGNDAFSGCSGLTSVTIGNGVTSIGEYAFYNCSGLTSITFADTTTWYRTTSSTNWQNKTGGTETDVTNASTNATNFTSTYYNCYWYKL